MKKILILKHGSLGDIILALDAFKAVKTKYSDSLIYLLTEEKYISFLKKSKLFNDYILDNRKGTSFKIIYNLSKIKFNIIIDLQNSQRTAFYNLFFRFFNTAKICSSRPFAHYRYKIPKQGTETVSMGLFNQLKLLGISEVKNNDYEWLKVEIKQKIIKPMALFIPGVSKNSISKQWEPVKFAKVASYLENIGYTICVIGTDNDKQSIFPIINECKNALNMINKSPPEIIYSLSLEAKIIFSNDTGPGHIAALSKNNIIWIGNQNRISRANLDNNKNFHKLLSSSVKNISHEEVINFINDKNLI